MTASEVSGGVARTVAPGLARPARTQGSRGRPSQTPRLGSGPAASWSIGQALGSAREDREGVRATPGGRLGCAGSAAAGSTATGLGSSTGKSLRTVSSPACGEGQNRGPGLTISVPPRSATYDSSRAQASAGTSAGSTSPMTIASNRPSGSARSRDGPGEGGRRAVGRRRVAPRARLVEDHGLQGDPGVAGQGIAQVAELPPGLAVDEQDLGAGVGHLDRDGPPIVVGDSSALSPGEGARRAGEGPRLRHEPPHLQPAARPRRSGGPSPPRRAGRRRRPPAAPRR